MSSLQPLDNLWVVLCACLVFFMNAGFALVESGFCRKKNAVMVLLKNVVVVALASLAYYMVGFGVMFGEGNGLIGSNGFFLAADQYVGVMPTHLAPFVFLFYQMVFAATAATIVSGAVAERSRLASYLWFVCGCSVVIYPLIGHWAWGGGWLAQRGFHDFAGSTVVHLVGGAMALAGVLAVGPRAGKYLPGGRVRPLPAHNIPLATLGVFILWLGWFGFNGGSTLAADPVAFAPVIFVTHLAASAGFFSTLVYVRWRTKMLDLSLALNGALAGLVGITAGADVIGPLESMLVGAICGITVVEAVLWMDRRGLDDPVGAIPVHLCHGLLGTIAVGFFANHGDFHGVCHGGGMTLLLVQLQGALVCGIVAFLGSAAVWFGLKYTTGVRVSPDDERAGLDASECGIDAYGHDPDVLGAA